MHEDLGSIVGALDLFAYILTNPSYMMMYPLVGPFDRPLVRNPLLWLLAIRDEATYGLVSVF